LSHATTADGTTAGFTLIEVLVALAIIAISLSSIGGLIATSVRGTRTIEDRLIRLETARAIATALPDRSQLVPGQMSGEMAGHRWRIDVSPLANVDPRQRTPWIPQMVVVTVQSPAGASLQINTARLQRRPRG
jgi:general secretion pathway protein I